MKTFEDFILENKNNNQIVNAIKTIIETSLKIRFNNKVDDFKFDYYQYKVFNIRFDFYYLPENFDGDNSSALITLQKIDYVKDGIETLEKYFSEKYKKSLNDFNATNADEFLYIYIQLDGNDVLYGHKDDPSLSNEIKSFLSINKFNL